MGRSRYRNILIRGVLYPDARTAALALSVQPQTIIRAIRQDRLDAVGLGNTRPQVMRARIRGVDYPDVKAAAAALGVTVSAIRQALHRDGHADNVGLPRKYNEARSHAFEFGGLKFASKARASRALGFGPAYISQALRRDSTAMKERIVAAAMQEAARRQDVVVAEADLAGARP